MEHDKGGVYSGELEHVDLNLPQGQICLRLAKSPMKLTEMEDAAAVMPIEDSALVIAVADGVGGAPGGHEAANQAMQSLATLMQTHATDDATLRPAIIDAIEDANTAILELGRGAGTTVAVVEIAEGAVRTYHVGDSEILVVGQRGALKHRVVPHSPTGFAVEAGLLDEDKAVHHEYRHILLNVVGSPSMRIEVGTGVKLNVRDTVLVASDGLFDNLYASEIIEVIRCGPLSVAADKLVALAHGRMLRSEGRQLPSKPDDLAIVLYRPSLPKKKRRRAQAAAQKTPKNGKTEKLEKAARAE